MSDSGSLVEAQVFYCCREKYLRSMQIAAVDGMNRFPESPAYKLFYSISLIHENRFSEAYEVLSEFDAYPHLALSHAILSSYVNSADASQDGGDMTSKVEGLSSSAGDADSYYAGICFILLNQPEKARRYISKVSKLPSFSMKASLYLGWIELSDESEFKHKDTWKYLENLDNSTPEAIFGKAKYFEKTKNYGKALEYLNQAIVLFPKYAPAFVEKMKMHLALEDWDQTMSASQRVLYLDSSNVEALRYNVLHCLAVEGQLEEATEKILQFGQMLGKFEPNNPTLYLETGQLFSGLSSGHKPILECTKLMVQKCIELKSTDSDYASELGYQYLLLGKVKKASKCFKSGTNDKTFTGTIHCLILQGDYELAAEQMKLFKDINSDSELSPAMLHLFGLLAHLQSADPEIVVNYLAQCLKLHFQLIKGMPLGVKYYRLLNPFFVHNVVKLFLQCIPEQLSRSKGTFKDVLKICEMAVSTIQRACPGMRDVLYSVAKLKYVQGDLSSAKSILNQCIDKYDGDQVARLQLARIHLLEGNHFGASHCLEVALSYNFEVKNNFDYLVIKAEIQRQQHLLKDALETLNSAKALIFPEESNREKSENHPDLSISEKMNLYIQIIHVLCDLNQQEKANKLISEAKTVFHESAEADRLIFATVYSALSRQDIDEALNCLDNIGPTHLCYLEALQRKADIYLNHKMNRVKYINCYRDAVKVKSTPESLDLLGDAYMKIQEPEKAIEAYEQALKQNPRDSGLARKIGMALVTTHHYEKAVTYYKAAIKSGGQECLRFDLCSLLCVIKRYREAEEMISAALENGRTSNDLELLMMESKYLCLLSEVYLEQKDKIGMEDQCMSVLQRAWNVQTRVLRRIHVEQPDLEQEQRKKAKEICCQIALHASRKKEYSSAVQFYREALTFDDNDTEILLSLAKLQMESQDIDAARQYCATVLSKDSENIAAAIMLADMMFEAGDLQSAKFQFQKLLDIKPDYFEAIARFIEVVRRLGKLDLADACLKKAEKMSSCITVDHGYYYCKGLYEWYTGNTSDALKCFNKSRTIPLWGQISLCHMIEICINPENENFSGDNVDSDTDTFLKEKAANSQEMNIRTAEKLLLELKSKYGASLNSRIFNNLIRIAKHNKADAEAALNDFLEILVDERYKDHAGAILGSAMGYLVLKQTPRARNQLKRLSKASWNFNDAEYLEKAWLLLADIYAKAGKFPSATEMLDKVLMYNKSCTKAYDLYGYIAEKEQNYRDAVRNFERAWVLTSKLNPVIGYKLAFNNMKAKRYADAIDACQMVLSKYPNYPKIRKEILERSRTYLRT